MIMCVVFVIFFLVGMVVVVVMMVRMVPLLNILVLDYMTDENLSFRILSFKACSAMPVCSQPCLLKLDGVATLSQQILPC